jgi:hypothetical protein
MNWTKEPPTAHGYYWVIRGDNDPEVVQLDKDGVLMVGFGPNSSMEFFIDHYGARLWFGPIECPPIDDKG